MAALFFLLVLALVCGSVVSQEFYDYVNLQTLQEAAGLLSQFGYATSVSGNTAAIGSYTTTNDDGIAIFYDPNDVGNFAPEEALAPINGGGVFGVAIATTSTMMIVGAPSYTFGTNNVGAAFVYQATGNMGRYHIKPNQTLSAANPANIGFGNAVAISNNLIVVGASGCKCLSISCHLPCTLPAVVIIISFFIN